MTIREEFLSNCSKETLQDFLKFAEKSRVQDVDKVGTVMHSLTIKENPKERWPFTGPSPDEPLSEEVLLDALLTCDDDDFNVVFTCFYRNDLEVLKRFLPLLDDPREIYQLLAEALVPQKIRKSLLSEGETQKKFLEAKVNPVIAQAAPEIAERLRASFVEKMLAEFLSWKEKK